MKTILLIIQREYLVRVRKKSFLIMTFLGPLLIVATYAIPAYLWLREGEQRTIAVLDKSGLFGGGWENSKSLKFVSVATPLAEAKNQVQSEKYYALLYIPENTTLADNARTEVKLFSKKGANVSVESEVRKLVEDKMQTLKLRQANIDTETLKEIEAYRVAISTATLDEETERESSGWALWVAGYASGFFIYIAIFLYGVQVMKGVVEEKTNRIVELLISSVKPFHLMMGKIVGIGLVGLTQFLLWIVLSTGISAVVQPLTGVARTPLVQAGTPAVPQAAPAKMQGAKFWDSLAEVLPRMVAGFLFFFLFGYLMYSALFAAVGAAADADADTQQFMLPITIPLVFSIIIATYVVQNPDSGLAFWTSIIPLTSPIIMLIRLPFNPPWWEVALSAVLLVAGFLGTTWVAARIYRVGVLMYGKKVNYRELSRWIFYKG